MKYNVLSMKRVSGNRYKVKVEAIENGGSNILTFFGRDKDWKQQGTVEEIPYVLKKKLREAQEDLEGTKKKEELQ